MKFSDCFELKETTRKNPTTKIYLEAVRNVSFIVSWPGNFLPKQTLYFFYYWNVRWSQNRKLLYDLFRWPSARVASINSTLAYVDCRQETPKQLPKALRIKPSRFPQLRNSLRFLVWVSSLYCPCMVLRSGAGLLFRGTKTPAQATLQSVISHEGEHFWNFRISFLLSRKYLLNVNSNVLFHFAKQRLAASDYETGSVILYIDVTKTLRKNPIAKTLLSNATRKHRNNTNEDHKRIH